MYNSRLDQYGQNKNMVISPNEASATRASERQAMDAMRREKLNEQSIQKDNCIKKYNEFLIESKNFLLTEALYKLLKSCFPEDIKESLLVTGKNIVTNFVNEESADSLLYSFSTKSVFLSEMANIVNSSYKSIIENAKEEREQFYSDFTIKNSDMEKFYDRLDQLDYSNMTNAIRAKVAQAEENFIQANINDRLDMEDMAEKTKEKIDNIKAKDKDTEEAIKQEHSRLYRAEVNKIMDRKRSILECLVQRTSESIMKDPALLEQYTTESGKFDTEKAINISEVMYTFLEMVNTARIKKVDESFIKNAIDSL